MFARNKLLSARVSLVAPVKARPPRYPFVLGHSFRQYIRHAEGHYDTLFGCRNDMPFFLFCQARGFLLPRTRQRIRAVYVWTGRPFYTIVKHLDITVLRESLADGGR